MNKINYKLINFAIVIIIFFLISKTTPFFIEIFSFIKNMLAPFIISFIISYVLNVFVLQINKIIKKKVLSNIIILFFTIIIIFFISYFTFPILVKQLLSLSKEIIPFINNLFDKTVLIKFPFFEDLVIENINKFILNISNNSFNIAIKSVNVFSNIIIIIILSIYLLFKMDNIKCYIYKKLHNNKKIISCIKEIDLSLNNYLKGISLIIFIEIIEYTLIYYIVGHPNFLLLGFLAGITTIIPYFGGLFTNLVALITSLGISFKLFIICSIIALIVPIIDNYIIDPRIYHKTTKINPLKAIFSIVIFSSIFGFIGLILAIPLYLIIEKIIKYIKIEKIE